MRSRTIVRCAVLLLVALLAIDASWCCDDTILMQPSTTTYLSAGSGVCDDEGGPLDCHACICSGLARIETTPVYAPSLQSVALARFDTRQPMSETAPVDIPPDKRA